ncbi:uncharacterized protein LOC127748622 [Frankliniella occidentalis]|uniref:Uncharacterized protein LOC127748622 n=1 Tax=Frankliniella occidentalis TaxID=133901 RepID=A0A9C6X9R7_FRAOC|nr:uncharacterized protein LOC127748622 [Frankliniella occidentalis]
MLLCWVYSWKVWCHKGVLDVVLQDLAPDPDDLVDNIYLIQMIESDGAPPCKRCKTADTGMQQLQRGADAGRQVVQQLRQVLPLAVEALQRQLDASAEQLRQMEEALQQQDVSQEQLQVAARLEDSLRVLTTECSVVAGRDGAACSRTPVQLGGVGDIVRAVLLQLQAEKVDDYLAPIRPAAYVGPPMTTIFSVNDDHLANGRLKVNEILRDVPRWRNIRCLKKLRGQGLRKLLPLLSSQLEELEFAMGEVQPPIVFEEVAKMGSLKRLRVACDDDAVGDYPDLPLQLEELVIGWPSEQQLRCVLRMPNLRSLRVTDYGGENVAFPPAQSGGLLWLGTAVSTEHKPTMLSLVRAHAASLKELEVFCTVTGKDYDAYYFPDLGRDLAACGLEHLQRLVLERLTSNRCKDVAGCLLQRQAIRGFLPRVDVVCKGCNASVL